MIITITGKIGEGKTHIAKNICGQKKYIILQEQSLNSDFCFSCIEQDTEFIIVDNVEFYDNVYNIFNREYLTINKKYQPPFQIKTPNVILIKKSILEYNDIMCEFCCEEVYTVTTKTNKKLCNYCYNDYLKDNNLDENENEIRVCMYCGKEIESGYYCSKKCEKADLSD